MNNGISVVICHHQGDLVYKAIESVKKSDYPLFEVIVVTSVPDLEFDGCRTVYRPGEPAEKRNIGVRFASYDYIAFFDDDVEIDKYCLRELYKVCSLDKVGMVFGKCKNFVNRALFDEAGSFLSWNGFLYSRGDRLIDYGQFDKVDTILAGKSANCMIKRSAFGKIGLFDEWMGILGEETDLSWRVWLYGYTVFFVPKAIAYHKFNTPLKPATFYNFKRVYYNGCRNYISMLFINLDVNRALVIIPIHILCWVTAGIGMALCGRISESKHIFIGIFSCFRNLPRLLRRRRKIQNDRVISDRDLSKFVFLNPSIGYYIQRLLRYWRSSVHG